MSSIGQTLHELPDLFCELDDRLDDARFRVEAASWLDHPSFASVVGQIVHELERGDPPARLRMRLGNAADRDWLLLACLVALDRAFAHVNPKSPQQVPPGMARLADHVLATGRLDSGVNGGALVPRVVTRPPPGQAPEHKRDLFANVIRVPERSWCQASFRVLGPGEGLVRSEVQRGLKVACAPVIADPAELEFRTLRRGTRRVYRIAPTGREVTRARISEIVEAMHRSGAKIGLAPELTLSRALLACWQVALRESSRSRRGGRLLWVLVGSGERR